VWVALKNFPLWLLAWGAVFTVQRYFWQAAGALRGQGRAGEFRRQHGAGTLAWTLVRAHAAAWWGAPRMLRKRWALRARRRLTHRAIRDLLRRFGLAARDVALRD
jgi:hypothetical protein